MLTHKNVVNSEQAVFAYVSVLYVMLLFNSSSSRLAARSSSSSSSKLVIHSVASPCRGVWCLLVTKTANVVFAIYTVRQQKLHHSQIPQAKCMLQSIHKQLH